MIFCRSCKKLWPAGSLFCGSCKRSFDGRRCPKLHLSPASARVCVVCGSNELTQAARSMRLGCLSVAFAWLIVLVLLRLGLENITATILTAYRLGDWVFGLVTGRSLSGVLFGLARCLLVTAILLTGMTAMLPKALRQPARTAFSMLANRIVHITFCLLRWGLRSLVRLVHGRGTQPSASNQERAVRERLT